MIKRFFKLLYVLALVAIVLWLPIFAVYSIHWDRFVLTDYKAKCLSNNQYVVLQGGKIDEPDILNEVYLNSNENRMAIKEQLNFYCKYYNEIQPHIIAYNKADTSTEKHEANMRFWEFRNSKNKVYEYPELYTLEVVNEETHPEEIYYPLINWLMSASIMFVVLQIIRICYVYVVFGKIVWHPFRKIS